MLRRASAHWETPERWEAHAPWAGIVFVALFLAGLLIAGDPGTESGAKIADHFAEHRTTILIGMYLAGLGLLAFFVWVWSLRTILSRTGEEALATAVLVAAVLVIAVEFPVIALDTGLAFISNQRVDPGLARALHDTARVFSYVDWFPTALQFAALALALRRSRLVASWLSWAGAAIAVLALVAAPPALGLDLPVSLISFLWIVVLSVALGRRRSTISSPPAKGRHPQLSTSRRNTSTQPLSDLSARQLAGSPSTS